MIAKGDIVDIPLKEYLSRLDIMVGLEIQLYSKSVDFPSQKVTVEPYLMGHLVVGDTTTQINVKNNYVRNYMDKFVENHSMIPER